MTAFEVRMVVVDTTVDEDGRVTRIAGQAQKKAIKWPEFISEKGREGWFVGGAYARVKNGQTVGFTAMIQRQVNPYPKL